MTSTSRTGATNGARRASIRQITVWGHGHPWGLLSVGYVDRAGGSRYQLTLFPPGTTPEQRRALLFRRQWLPWGFILWFLVSSALSTAINGWTAIAIGGAIYVGVLLIANAHAGAARHDVIEVRAQVLSLMGSRQAFGDLELVQNTVAALSRLDELAAENQITPLEYELRWGEIYRDVLAHQGAADA